MSKPKSIREKTLSEFPDLYDISFGNPKAVKSQKKKDYFKKQKEEREIIFDETTENDKPLFEMELAINNCPLVNCSINNGVGGCVSDNKIQCKSIPDNFNEDK